MAAGGNSGTMPFGMEVKIDNYPKAVATAACTQLMKCSCPGAEEVMKCVSKRFPPIFVDVKDLKASVEAGKATFSGAKLADCLNRQAALSCDVKQADLDTLKGCTYIAGTVANAGVCTNGFDCKEGYCAKSEGKTTMECFAKKAIDAVCTDGVQCASGNCMKAKPEDAMGKCAAAVAPMPGICSFFK